MNILLVSQCSKKALNETRRVLDQFAERCGDRVWQTPITQQGLDTLRRLLKRTARRNTSVACHWIRGKNNSELLWVVGNPRRFNAEGRVPTNMTARDVLKADDENQWQQAEDIALLSGIAALFHDFGKANVLFQKKLMGEGKSFEAYRHEWVSLRMFEAFVAGAKDDKSWLERLATITPDFYKSFSLSGFQDGIDNEASPSPFRALPPMAQAVAWLILSHHKLPMDSSEDAPSLRDAEYFLIHQLHPKWNSPQLEKGEWKKTEIKNNWKLAKGSPFKSKTWCAKAKRIALRALKRPAFWQTPWLEQGFSLHMARLSLMLADHYFSSIQGQPIYRDKSYKVYANTNRETGELKQQLDEHLIGVYKNALHLVRVLPDLRASLPAIGRHKGFKKRSKISRFAWQDKAYDLASSIKKQSQKQGFFGVNLASTGCGKTFANSRIMYGLSDEAKGCRFSVALGLRTLTLQTGDALRDKLKLDQEDLAVMVGSQAVTKLYQWAQQEQNEKVLGSESSNAFIEDDTHVVYEGGLSEGPLARWLETNPKAHKLVSAPVLVSTIDHLMPATEGARGGKQIAPMLRLLTSDLVLDEPDDFDTADLPALCRLVHWAGMLGSRVLLSSATLAPALVKALFEAYCHGRAEYQKAVGEPGLEINIPCAWFDENQVAYSQHKDSQQFAQAHRSFIEDRVKWLDTQPQYQKPQIQVLPADKLDKQEAIGSLAEVIFHQALALHQVHSQVSKNGKTSLSVGLVRFANINPLVAMAKALLQQKVPPDTAIHVCLYHSKHPLIVRSGIEQMLDTTLKRHEPEAIFEQPSIKNALNLSPATQHIFIVLGTAVTEVGRDHDYDWAIVEPSSMRSLIQLAGRIQRHRKHLSESPNLVILETNYKGLIGEELAFVRPGFESQSLKLHSHRLTQVLTPEQRERIDAVARIRARENPEPNHNLVDLEHERLTQTLFDGGDGPAASIWWQKPCALTYQMQLTTPFRQSSPELEYCLYIEEEEDTPVFCELQKDVPPLDVCSLITDTELHIAENCFVWGERDYCQEIALLAEKLEQPVSYLSQVFGGIKLRTLSGAQAQKGWCYHPVLGFHQEIVF